MLDSLLIVLVVLFETDRIILFFVVLCFGLTDCQSVLLGFFFFFLNPALEIFVVFLFFLVTVIHLLKLQLEFFDSLFPCFDEGFKHFLSLELALRNLLLLLNLLVFTLADLLLQKLAAFFDFVGFLFDNIKPFFKTLNAIFVILLLLLGFFKLESLAVQLLLQLARLLCEFNVIAHVLVKRFVQLLELVFVLSCPMKFG